MLSPLSPRARQALIDAMAADLVALRREHGAANRADLVARGWLSRECDRLADAAGRRADALAQEPRR